MEIALSGYQIELKPVTESDLERLRAWRNSDHVRYNMLNSDTIDQEQQRAWFKHISQAKNQLHFVIFYREQAIGSCNIKTRGLSADINKAKAFELGLYIGDERYVGNIIAFAPVLLMNDYCFEQLGADCIHAVVKAENQAALRYNMKLGYQVEQASDLIHLCLTRRNYDEHTRQLKQLLDRPVKNKRSSK